MKNIFCLVAIFAFTACADINLQKSDTAHLARAVIVGKSKAEVVACAGNPERAELNGETESLHYSASSGQSTLMVGAGDKLLSTVPYSCQVTIVLRRGYVEDVLYAGRTGRTLASDEECAPVVAKCLRPRN